MNNIRTNVATDTILLMRLGEAHAQIIAAQPHAAYLYQHGKIDLDLFNRIATLRHEIGLVLARAEANDGKECNENTGCM